MKALPLLFLIFLLATWRGDLWRALSEPYSPSLPDRAAREQHDLGEFESKNRCPELIFNFLRIYLWYKCKFHLKIFFENQISKVVLKKFGINSKVNIISIIGPDANSSKKYFLKVKFLR